VGHRVVPIIVRSNYLC